MTDEQKQKREVVQMDVGGDAEGAQRGLAEPDDQAAPEQVLTERDQSATDAQAERDQSAADAQDAQATQPDSAQDGQAAQANNAQDDQAKPRFSHADIFKFVGLLAFFAIMVVIIIAIWPYVGEVFEPGGIERIKSDVHDAGVFGVFILLALQFLQVVVAFIPGEVVQIAAGMIYGPWFGALIIWIGCIISSSIIFALVHKLGAPFVQSMVPKKYLQKFSDFEQSSKFNSIVFVLFLIPGMPKDVFTYITPLSHMKLSTFIVITNVARIPGIIVSTYAADGLMEGRIWESVVLFTVLAIIAVIALVVYNKIGNKNQK